MQRMAMAVALAVLVSTSAFSDEAPLPAQRITITLATGRLPDAEAVVKTLERPGPRHEVRVKVQKAKTGQSMQIELWGNSAPASDVDSLLRAKFPALGSASIDVAPLGDPPPAIEGEKAGHGRKVIVKKKVIHTDG